MKRLKNRTLTSMVVSWLLLVGLILPCLLLEGGEASLFALGAVAEGSGHSHGDHHHGNGQGGYCCHDSLVYARDEAPSAREAILFAKASPLSAWASPVGFSDGSFLLNSADRLLFSLHLRQPTSPDLFLLHSILLI